MLCCSLLPQLSSAEAGDQKAPWNPRNAPQLPKATGLAQQKQMGSFTEARGLQGSLSRAQ